MNRGKISVTLNKSKIITNGFFKKNTFKVGVYSYPMGWKVVRTLEDFKWLHTSLRNRFPGNYIVELPDVEATEDSRLNDQYMLNCYINHIVNSPSLLYSPELVEFLKLSENDFPKARAVKVT